MAIQKITADVISSDAITTASISDSAITAAKLAGTLDLTGKTITVATASSGDNDTSPASTAFVQQELASLVDSAPGTLNTLNELAAALGDDANFSTTVTNSIATKVPLAGGTMTGNLVLGDSVKAIFGTDSDLKIQHNGSNSFIDNETGQLLIRNKNDDGDVDIQSDDGSGGLANYFRADGSTGSAILYNYGNTKLATTSSGVDVTGTAVTDGLTVASDTDTTVDIGRAKIGYMGFADFAGFAHRDKALTGSYALLQYSTGETYLNAASGRDINIRINNSNVALFNSEGNFGIGTTSLTNNTLGKTTYFGNNTSTITGDSSQARFWLGNNWYYNSGDKFIDTGYANLYTQQSGTHQFLTSTASGSAGQAATFANVLTIDASGKVGMGTSTIPHGNVGGAKLAIEGTDASASAGPHVQYTTTVDDYPVFQQLNWSHDNISLNFDAYFDGGGWKSSDPGSNFQIYKDVDKFNINYDSNIAAGTGVTWNKGFTMSSTGLVGIGQANPATKLHVYGTNPVIRVSDDGTTGYSTLELRQQNTGNEGSELMYNSGTGHTHLNTVYGADLKIATNTGSFGTTGTNIRLVVKSDGVIEVGSSNVSTDRIKFVGNTNVNAPSTSNHDLGTRLSLFDSSTNAFYAIGIESNHMWFNADDGGSYKFYTRGNQKVHIDCSSPMPEFRVGTDSTNAMTLGSVTAVFPYSGPTLIVATPGAQLTVHNGTNSHTNWVTLNSSLSDYLRGTATFSTINTSQQANIIVYLNVATKVYLARQTNWNPVSTTGWTQISDDSTVISDNNSHDVYVRYLPAGTHSLDNDSALYFFEAPIGP